jgi:hypothetical protein
MISIYHFRDLGINQRVILKCRIWAGFIWLMIWYMAGSYEHSNAHLGYIKGGEFLE